MKTTPRNRESRFLVENSRNPQESSIPDTKKKTSLAPWRQIAGWSSTKLCFLVKEWNQDLGTEPKPWNYSGIPSRSLTACPLKMVVGRLLSYWVSVTFQGRTVKLPGGRIHRFIGRLLKNVLAKCFVLSPLKTGVSF